MGIGQNALGTDFAETSTTKLFKLGTIRWSDDGKAYIYCQANGAITGDGYAVVIDEAFQAALLTTSNDTLGDKVGVADVAFADNEYGWIQIYGPCGIRSAASAAANTRLIATATGGEIDDGSPAAGAMYIDGMILGAATGGSAAVNASGSLNWPTIRQLPSHV